MTTETDTHSVMTEMQSALARMAAKIRDLEEQNARLESAGAAQDSLKQAVMEFDRSRRVKVPGQRMVGPCVREKDGVVCGRPWEEHCSEEEGVKPLISSHTYIEKVLPHPEKRKPRAFYVREGVVQVEKVEEEDAYVSVSEAAKMLSITGAEVKQMIADGGLKAIKVGRSVIIRKTSVDRIVTMAEMEGV